MKNSVKKLLLILVFSGCYLSVSWAQEATKILPLNDLSPFREQAGNWMIVGEVAMDPTIDIHHKEEKVDTRKSKKKKKGKDEEIPQAVSYQPGTGILLNLNDEIRKDHLVTDLVHGDIELELEVMLPKGSNSGIYLQGRYEIQLLDSWGTKTAKYSDIGGIYRNWETEPGKIYMGKAPLSNAAKAPGLWQTIHLLFKAPKFDANENKTANAKFVFVDLNGVRIHDNIEVPLPTGGPLENNETAMGPIMIQGDHGPVAIRNVRYRLFHDLEINLSDLSYKVYHGDFKGFEDIEGKKPVLEGTSKVLTYEVADKDDAYAIVYNGMINITEDGTYTFFPEFTGGMRLTVAGKQLLNLNWTDGMFAPKGSDFQIELKKGAYPIEIVNLKNVAWRSPRLGLFVKKPDSHKVPLHAFSSNPPDDDNVPPVYVDVETQPTLLRAFIDYKGKREDRITHSIGVGDPSGTHYVYDLKSGNLVCVWRGDFVDATPMWHDRGDGSFRPMGAVQFLINNQQLTVLSDSNSPFPGTGDKEDFRGLGYNIEESSGRPVFSYRYRDVNVKDKIYPGETFGTLVRELSIENPTNRALSFKLAEGKTIEKMSAGYYAIDDRRYYIKLPSTSAPVVREINGTKELVLPVQGNSISYSIIW